MDYYNFITRFFNKPTDTYNKSSQMNLNENDILALDK